MVDVLFKESWLKPLLTESLPSERCNICKKRFKDLDFITSCEFCEIGLIHDVCSNKHILTEHMGELKEKIDKHKEKGLHSFQ